jgi:hypothetical protein
LTCISAAAAACAEANTWIWGSDTAAEAAPAYPTWPRNTSVADNVGLAQCDNRMVAIQSISKLGLLGNEQQLSS